MNPHLEPLEGAPWILFGATEAYGVPVWVVDCRVCNVRFTGDEENAALFVEEHQVHQSASQTHMGAGDVVAQLAKSLGFVKPCTPCEARRQALNNAVPAVPFMRRR